MSHDGPEADPKGHGLATTLVEGMVSALQTLLPKVPDPAAAVLALLIVGVLVELVLAVVGAGTVAMAIVAGLVVVAIAASLMILLRSGSIEQAAPAGGDTRALADKLSADQHDAVCDIVEHAVHDACDVLGAHTDRLRGNVWGCDGADVLHILPEFNCNMTFIKERTLEWPIGQGNTGRAWVTGQPSIAVRRDDGWGDAAVPLDQRGRLHPDLTWVVSVPVFAHARAGAAPTWILSVDGINDPRSEKELEKVVGSMVGWAYQLGLVLGAAVR